MSLAGVDKIAKGVTSPSGKEILSRAQDRSRRHLPILVTPFVILLCAYHGIQICVDLDNWYAWCDS